MKTVLSIFVFFLSLAWPAKAQNPAQIQPVAVAPSGHCSNNQMRLKTPDGTIYTCQSGTWAQISGSGCTASGSSGVVQGSNGSGGCQSTSITDNGTTVSTTESVATGVGGSNAGTYLGQCGTASIPASPANATGLIAPSSCSGQHLIGAPSSGAAATSIMTYATESGNVSQGAYKGYAVSSSTAGQVVCNDGSNGLKDSGCSGGGGSVPLTVDAFMPNNSTGWSSGTANIGALGWISEGSGQFQVANQYGSRAELDFSGVNTETGLGLAGNVTFSSGYAPVYNVSNRTFKYEFDFQMDNNFTTQAIIRVGLADAASQLPSNGVWVRYNNNNACTNTGTDSTFIGETRASGTSSTVNTTVSVVAADYYSVLIYATAGGTIQFQVATNGGAYSSAVTLSTNIPTVNLVPVFEAFACDSSGHKFWAQRFVWWN